MTTKALLNVFNRNDVNLNELAIERLRCGGNVRNDQFFEIRNHPAILTVAMKRDLGVAGYIDFLAVIDRKNLMANFVLTIQKVVLFRFGNADLVNIVGCIVFLATDIKIVSNLLAVFVHHRLHHTTKSKRNFVAFSFLTAEIPFDRELICLRRIAIDERRDAVGSLFRIFRHGIFAGKLEAVTTDRRAWLGGGFTFLCDHVSQIKYRHQHEY